MADHQGMPPFGTEHICPMCGKTFIPAVYHIYTCQEVGKQYRKKVCSWTCQLESERIHAEKKKRTYNHQKKEMGK